MRQLKGAADLHDLPTAFRRSKIDRRTNTGASHVISLLDGGEKSLIMDIRIREQFIMINLEDERNLMGIFARDGSQHAKRRRDSIAAALDRQANDIFRIEIFRIRSERSCLPNAQCPDRPEEWTDILYYCNRPWPNSCCRLRNVRILRSLGAKIRSTQSGPGRCNLSLETVLQTCFNSDSASLPNNDWISEKFITPLALPRLWIDGQSRACVKSEVICARIAGFHQRFYRESRALFSRKTRFPAGK